MVAGDRDALFEVGGAEPDQGSGHVGGSRFGLLISGFRQRRIRRLLSHHGAGVQLGEVSGDPDGIDQVGAGDLMVDGRGDTEPVGEGLDR